MRHASRSIPYITSFYYYVGREHILYCLAAHCLSAWASISLIVRVRFLFDLVSYCDVRAQLNAFITERDKHVLVERATVRILWRGKIE